MSVEIEQRYRKKYRPFRPEAAFARALLSGHLSEYRGDVEHLYICRDVHPRCGFSENEQPKHRTHVQCHNYQIRVKIRHSRRFTTGSFVYILCFATATW